MAMTSTKQRAIKATEMALSTALSMLAKEVDTILKELATIRMPRAVTDLHMETKTLTNKLTGKAFVKATTRALIGLVATHVDVAPTIHTTIPTIATTILIIDVVDLEVMATTSIA